MLIPLNHHFWTFNPNSGGGKRSDPSDRQEILPLSRSASQDSDPKWRLLSCLHVAGCMGLYYQARRVIMNMYCICMLFIVYIYNIYIYIYHCVFIRLFVYLWCNCYDVYYIVCMYIYIYMYLFLKVFLYLYIYIYLQYVVYVHI